MKSNFGIILWTTTVAVLMAGAASSAEITLSQTSPLSDATILIIRHAEKPLVGTGLSAEGEVRAKAYVSYFQNFRIGSKPIHLDYLVAADDSEHSQRSRLTLE